MDASSFQNLFIFGFVGKKIRLPVALGNTFNEARAVLSLIDS
jgi:hypothetical protein